MIKRTLPMAVVLVASLISSAGTPASDAGGGITAEATTCGILINKVPSAVSAYNIGGFNYFRLRDIAYTLTETHREFDIAVDQSRINLLTGKAYASDEDIMRKKEERSAVTAYPNDTFTFAVDGQPIFIDAYNIDGSNFVKLRDLANAINFDVRWTGETNTIDIITENLPELKTVTISGSLAHRDIPDLLSKSCLIVEGTVTGCSEAFQIRSIYGSVHNYTDYYLEISSKLRGEAGSETITIRTDGGTVGKYREIWDGSPKFATGGAYLLFLCRPGCGCGIYAAGDSYYVLGLTQGVFTKDGDGYVSQARVTLSAEELRSGLEAVSGLPVDAYCFRNEFIENQKRNLETGFISQEEFDEAMKNLDVYATVVR